MVVLASVAVFYFPLLCVCFRSYIWDPTIVAQWATKTFLTYPIVLTTEGVPYYVHG